MNNDLIIIKRPKNHIVIKQMPLHSALLRKQFVIPHKIRPLH